jgi:uncharacterized membrane protein YfcA
MTSLEITALVTAAFLAGAMNAVAGGGTVLTFPALIAFGMPMIQANATSTLALLVGILGSVYGYRRQIRVVAPLITRFGAVSILGGLLGALLLTHTRESTFSALVPFLLLFATILFLANNTFRRLVRIEPLAKTSDVLHHRGILLALGYFAASHFAQRMPQAAVRGVAAAIGLCISAWLLWKQFA